jgi:hypothetical protein
LVVKTPAITALVSENISAISFFFVFFIPADTPENLNPGIITVLLRDDIIDTYVFRVRCQGCKLVAIGVLNCWILDLYISPLPHHSSLDAPVLTVCFCAIGSLHKVWLALLRESRLG